MFLLSRYVKSILILITIYSSSKDDVNVKVTNLKKTPKAVIERDPNAPPVSAALVNGKYVTYTRITRDVAVLFFTCADSLVRRFYLIKILETYCDTLGCTLVQLGVNPDSYGMNYHSVINDFQQHILYGFIVGILISMANTNPEEIEMLLSKTNNHSDKANATNETNNDKGDQTKFIPLTDERIRYLMDLMRDVAYYVESKDFELGLPLTNFHRYHELWCMKSDMEEENHEETEEVELEEEEYSYEYSDEEEEEEDNMEEVAAADHDQLEEDLK